MRGLEMDTYLLRIFQTHVRDQCQFLIMSAEMLKAGLQEKNINRTLYAIQNILTAGANISKMLWGQKGRHAEARKRLRESIDITDDSPLRHVAMRNHFEHMDERIDRWWAESKRRNHADAIIGPREAIFGLEAIETFRWFDPTTMEIIFWGEAFNLGDIVSEAERVLPKLVEESSKPHWDQLDHE